MSEYNDEEYDEEYEEEEEVVEKKETSMVEKIIHAVLAPLVYTPLIMLALIYLFSMNMEKFLYIDKKLPYCKKNFAGVWKSYNINYKDYYRKMNPWSIFNFIFNEDKSCSGGGNFLSYYLGKYYYNMILLPSNKLHYFLKYWLSPDSINIDKMKKLISRSPEVNIKNPNKPMKVNFSAKDIFTTTAFFKQFLLNTLTMLLAIPFSISFVSIFYSFYSAINNIEGFGVLLLIILAALLFSFHIFGHVGLYIYWLFSGYNNNVYKLMKASVHKDNWRTNYLIMFFLIVAVIELKIWVL
jgi:hypothetical protein